MEKYKTSDVYLAAYLKAKDYKLSGLDKDGKKVIFIFEKNEDEVKPMVLEYMNKDGQVVPMIFVDEIKSLKQLVFSV